MTTDTIRTRMDSFAPAKVGAMTRKINESLEARHEFEKNNGGLGKSWLDARSKVENAIGAVSPFFLALNIEPSTVIERQIVEGKMFNAKSLKKVVELAQFAAGTPGANFEKVLQAFIACAIMATDKLGEGTPFTNDVNASFLSSRDLTAYIKDKDLIEAMEDQRHKTMTTGAATQSSQTRNVLDVLGMGAITKVNRERDAIKLNLSHPVIELFREEKMAA